MLYKIIKEFEKELEMIYQIMLSFLDNNANKEEYCMEKMEVCNVKEDTIMIVCTYALNRSEEEEIRFSLIEEFNNSITHKKSYDRFIEIKFISYKYGRANTLNRYKIGVHNCGENKITKFIKRNIKEFK